MPYHTENPVIEKVERLLLQSFRAAVQSDPTSNLTAMILSNGGVCIHLKPAEDDLKELVNDLVLSKVLHYTARDLFSKAYVYSASSEQLDDLLVDHFTTEFLFQNCHSVDARSKRCESVECKIFIERLEKCGAKIYTDTIEKDLSSFVEIFEGLCLKYDVPLVAGQSDYAIRRCVADGVVGEAPEYYYQFNVLPEDMHKILMGESAYYAGYHYDGSILRLNNPNYISLKEGAMCIFPAFKIEDEKVILRNAGCNIVDVLATQLSFYIRNYLQPDLPILDCYGHRSTPIIDKFSDHNELIKAAKKCLGTTWGYEDSQEGISEVSIASKYVLDMDKAAYEIYNRLSAVSSDELENLQSVEVPLENYLEALIDVKKEIMEYFSHELQGLHARLRESPGNSHVLKDIENYETQVAQIREYIIPSLQQLIEITKKHDVAYIPAKFLSTK